MTSIRISECLSLDEMRDVEQRMNESELDRTLRVCGVDEETPVDTAFAMMSGEYRGCTSP